MTPPAGTDRHHSRLRILVAAETVFGAKGLDASTAEVARLAGVGISTVDRHFATKEALVDAVFAGRLHRLAERARELTRQSHPARSFFDYFAGMVGENPGDRLFADALSRAGSDAEAAAAHPDHPLHTALDRLLQRAQRAGGVRPDIDVGDLVAIMVGTVHAIRHTEGDSHMRSRVLAVFVDGLRQPSRKRR